MDWIEVTIKTTREGTDVMAQVLYEVGVQGVVIEDPADIQIFTGQEGEWDYIDESLFKNGSEEVCVKGYLSDDTTFHDKLKYIQDRVRTLLNYELGMDLRPGTIELSNVKEEDWANNWKKFFKPRKVGAKVVIKPSWEEYSPKQGEIVLELDPGMAFGTGTHETTILCIKALEDMVKPSTNILDVGCGTGVLAIASILLGANKAVAVDIDRNAVKVASENAKRNGVSDRIKVVQGNLMDDIEGQYDIIIANIIADVIIGMSRDVKHFLKAGGVFISSGIIIERVNDVEKTLIKEGFTVLEKKTMGEWAVIISRYE